MQTPQLKGSSGVKYHYNNKGFRMLYFLPAQHYSFLLLDNIHPSRCSVERLLFLQSIRLLIKQWVQIMKQNYWISRDVAATGKETVTSVDVPFRQSSLHGLRMAWESLWEQDKQNAREWHRMILHLKHIFLPLVLFLPPVTNFWQHITRLYPFPLS